MTQKEQQEKDRIKLDKIIRDTDSYNEKILPKKLINDINKWEWGTYGWTSPASLIITVAWRKYLYPSIDCCKIWAKDAEKKDIPGGYSIRSEDEKITIPLMAKYDLCKDFCSPNSGMQGSRAIEKMRSEKRLNLNFNSTQSTVFDLKLFASILNQINELSSKQALEVFKMLILKAKQIKEKRIKHDALLSSNISDEFNLRDFLSKTSDPELTKCVVAACFDILYKSNGLTVTGVDDYKTAADARAEKPGDLALEKDKRILAAIEVKDKTQEIDWNNIDRAKTIMSNFPEIGSFIYVLEKRTATLTKEIREMVESNMFKTDPCNKICFISVHDLLAIAGTLSDIKSLAIRTGEFLSLAPDVKSQTKEKWLELINTKIKYRWETILSPIYISPRFPNNILL